MEDPVTVEQLAGPYTVAFIGPYWHVHGPARPFKSWWKCASETEANMVCTTLNAAYAAARASGGERGKVLTDEEIDNLSWKMYPEIDKKWNPERLLVIECLRYTRDQGYLSHPIAQQNGLTVEAVMEVVAELSKCGACEGEGMIGPEPCRCCSEEGGFLSKAWMKTLRTRITGLVGGDQWISVEERLPEYVTDGVLVANEFGVGETAHRWNNFYGWISCMGEGNTLADVTHWMPFPTKG